MGWLPCYSSAWRPLLLCARSNDDTHLPGQTGRLEHSLPGCRHCLAAGTALLGLPLSLYARAAQAAATRRSQRLTNGAPHSFPVSHPWLVCPLDLVVVFASPINSQLPMHKEGRKTPSDLIRRGAAGRGRGGAYRKCHYTQAIEGVPCRAFL